MPDVPAYGVRCFAHTRGSRSAGDTESAAARTEPRLTNGRIAAVVHDDGRVEFSDAASRRTIPDLLAWESRKISVTRTRRRFAPRNSCRSFAARASFTADPCVPPIESRWEFRRKSERVITTVTLVVDADAPWLRILVRR